MLLQTKELASSYQTVSIFIMYMATCVGQGIFITFSRQGASTYDYNTVTAVLLTEIVKLAIAVCGYLRNNDVPSLIFAVKKDIKICGFYLVPSFLYCIYNNLAYVNLAAFDPTTYYLLLQLRVVVTGVIFQIIFSRKLSGVQWLSLLLLTSGCMLQQLKWDHFVQSETNDLQSFNFSFNLVFILIQTVCSCLAGVYNEYLLKGKSGNVDFFIQNIFMYIDSILWNILALLLKGDLVESLSSSSIASLLKPLVIIIVINNALIGIITALFLKNLNSILKTFASALEVVFTAVLSFLIFGIPIRPNTWMAIAVVSFAIYLYTNHPIAIKPKVEKKTLASV